MIEDQVLLDCFKRELLKKEKEISAVISAGMSSSRENELDSSRALDTGDIAEIISRRRVEIRILESQNAVLNEIKRALRRIREKNFGECAGCSGEISLLRLKAVPWALFCIHCANREELKRRQDFFGDGAADKSCQFGKFEREND